MTTFAAIVGVLITEDGRRFPFPSGGGQELRSGRLCEEDQT